MKMSFAAFLAKYAPDTSMKSALARFSEVNGSGRIKSADDTVIVHEDRNDNNWVVSAPLGWDSTAAGLARESTEK